MMFIGRFIESRREPSDRGAHFFLGEPTDFVVRTYCGQFSSISEIVEPYADVQCPTCSGRYLMESDTHISGPEAALGEEAYRKVFNGSILEGVELEKKTKPIKEMTDEELTSFIYEMEDFIRRSRIVAQAARINLEDRKLRYTDEQMKALRELDKKFKPKPAARENDTPRERKAAVKDPYEKKLAALIDLMGMTAEQAVEYLTAKGITRENAK